MPQEVLRQSNFNGGELSPSAIGRRDLKAYASSLALCVNMIPLAEGPIRRRPGLAHLDLIRNRLEPVTVTTGMLGNPNGGDLSNLFEAIGMATATPIGSTDPYVVLEVNFGEETEVGLVDLIDFALVEAGTEVGGDADPLPDPVPPQYPWQRPDGLEPF